MFVLFCQFVIKKIKVQLALNGAGGPQVVARRVEGGGGWFEDMVGEDGT